MRRLYLEILIFVKVPWVVRRLFENRIILVEREWGGAVLETAEATFLVKESLDSRFHGQLTLSKQ